MILQAAQLVFFSFQDQSHETGHVPIVVGFHSVFHGQCSQFGGCLKVGRTKLGSWSFTFFQHLSMNSNHTTLVIWINPKFGGRFGLSGDGIFWDTWIPRGLRLHFCPWSVSHLSPRAVNFMSWYVGLLLSISRMTVNSLCHAAGMFTGKFSFACV